MRTLAYALLDVFAERPFEGNQLAVFADATGLSAETMQTIAREMNLSETAFILPRAPDLERERGVRVRIFTTEEELPFAGHPTLGTATWLHEHHPLFRGDTTLALELNVGRIPVAFAPPDPSRPGSFATMRQNDPTFTPVGGPAWPSQREFATALGLTPADLGFPRDPAAPIQVVSTGTAFCIVPLRSLAVARRLVIPQALARPLLERLGVRFFYCLAPTEPSANPAAWHGRMQFRNGEDPATGSAAGCVAAWLVHHGLAGSGHEILLEQGIEMLRPSRLTLRASRSPSGITDVFVGGRTIPVASGQLFLP